jgi:hypothetical protein
MAAENLSPAEVTELCTAGYAAWDKLGPKQSEAWFTWRRRRYVAKHTGFRLTVDNEKGEPVACRYD